MLAFITVGLFVLFLSHIQVRDRVSKLEQQLSKKLPIGNQFEAGSEAPLLVSDLTSSTQSQPPAVDLPPIPVFTPVAVGGETALHEAVPASELFLYTWFKEHTLIKIGGIFFFLGAVWFVSYAISAGWISPQLRIFFGFALAIVAYGLGWYRAQTEVTQYVVLTALGTGISCATLSAAQIIFSLLSPLLALFILAVSLSYTAYVAWQTKTNWLLLCTGVAGLLVPAIIGYTTWPLWLLLYLLLLSGGLLLASFKLDSRPVTLLLAVGVLMYEVLLFASVSPNLLWFFVVLFSLLFFASVTMALIHSPEPRGLDIVNLVVIGITFVFFASTIAPSSSIATFVATLVISGTGYVLTKRQTSSGVVAVYAGFAAAGLLLATSFLFSGFTLVLAYVVEITAVFLVSTYLGLPERVVWVATLCYLLPLLGSLDSFTSIRWQAGVWHADAAVLYAMTASLVLSALWLIHKPAIAVYRWSKTAAAVFGVVGFFYAYAVLAVVATAIFQPTEALAVTYITWALLSLGGTYYSLQNTLPLKVTYYFALSLLFPVSLSLRSFSSAAWELGVQHSDCAGVFSLTFILLLTTLLLTQQYCKEYDSTLKALIAGFIVATVAYLFITLSVFWPALLPVSALATVATYMSYACVLYALTSLFVLLRTSLAWISSSLVAFVIPILLSLDSFAFSGWPAGVLSPEAVGLFGLIALFVMLALGLRQRYAGAKSEDLVLVKRWSTLLLGLAFLYAIGLVWSLAHTLVLAREQAISLALFVYTIVGLWSYQHGKRKVAAEYRYAGITLLTLVVVHLLLIDIWGMELLWRVVTFLGIGMLFIGTALFERRH